MTRASNRRHMPDQPATHPRVAHPRDLAARQELSRVNEWITAHLTLALGSVTGMWLAFLVPLLAFEIPWLLKVLGLVSSYWVQLWALFVLQRSANRGDAQRQAKADADHAALTSIHLAVDEIRSAVCPSTGGS